MHTRILSTFLNELDGISSSVGAISAESNILICVACSDINKLDEAILRPGRLQHHIYLGLPNLEDIIDIIRAKLPLNIPFKGLYSSGVLKRENNDALFSDINSESLVYIAKRLLECAPRVADVVAACRKAAFSALREEILSYELMHSNS